MDRRRFLLTPLVRTVLDATAVNALPVFGWLVP